MVTTAESIQFAGVKALFRLPCRVNDLDGRDGAGYPGAMSVTRGDFLKQLGKSLPGMVMGGGIAAAAQTFLGKVAAASGAGNDATPPAHRRIKSANHQDDRAAFVTMGPVDGKRIALTFDDGPTPGVTELILDELQRRRLHATFFMIGERIAGAPELARRVLAEGHEIGNHTFTHPKLNQMTDLQIDVEIQKTQDVMRDLLGCTAHWFRPPYGALRPSQAGIPAAQGLRVALWSVDSRDWTQPGEAEIVRAVLAETRPGSIILCHDLHRQTANGLGAILEGLLERGSTFETLSTFLPEDAAIS